MAEARIYIGMDDLIKLIGGDGEAEVRLKNTIIQQFTDKYLRGLVNLDSMKKIASTIKDGIGKEVAEQVGQVSYGSVKLKPEVKKAIAEQVQTEIRSAITEAVTDAVVSVKESIKARIEASVRSFTESEIQRQATALVNAHLEAVRKQVGLKK